MRVLFIGDIFGSAGRKIVHDHLAHVVETNRVDLVIANAENAAGGFGITPGIANAYQDGIAHRTEQRGVQSIARGTSSDATCAALPSLRYAAPTEAGHGNAATPNSSMRFRNSSVRSTRAMYWKTV